MASWTTTSLLTVIIASSGVIYKSSVDLISDISQVFWLSTDCSPPVVCLSSILGLFTLMPVEPKPPIPRFVSPNILD